MKIIDISPTFPAPGPSVFVAEESQAGAGVGNRALGQTLLMFLCGPHHSCGALREGPVHVSTCVCVHVWCMYVYHACPHLGVWDVGGDLM